MGEQPPLKVFMYNSSLGCSSDARGHPFLFQQKLFALFEGGFMRTHDPSRASIFFHPACLVDLFFRMRGQRNRKQVAAALELQVLDDIARVGWAHKPHIVNALRCFTADLTTRNMAVARTAGVFPVLWSSRFFRFCAEAFPRLNQNTSIYMPYCTRTPAPQPALKPDRPISIVFVGTVPKRRGGTRARRIATIAALRRTPGAKIELLGSRAADVNVSARAIELMRDATYTLCPYGDTPESRRIYQALSVGSIPIVEDDFQRPAFAPWGSFSTRIQRLCECRCACPNATFRLPSAWRQRSLQLSAVRHAKTFECEPDNPAFTTYIQRAVRKLVGCQPKPTASSSASANGTLGKVSAEALGCTPMVPSRRLCLLTNNSIHPSCKGLIGSASGR